MFRMNQRIILAQAMNLIELDIGIIWLCLVTLVTFLIDLWFRHK